MIRSQKELAEVSQPTESLTSSDRLLLRYNDTKDWAQRNSKIVFGGLAVVILIVGGLAVYGWQRSANEDKASVLLGRIVQEYASGDYQHAIYGNPGRKVGNENVQGLRYIVSEYGSTPSGNEAALMLANSYYYLGKYDSASMMYEKVSSALPTLQASAEAGRAAVLEQKGNKEEAAKLFQSAAKRDESNPLNADYLLAAAHDLEQVGKKDDAITLYKKLISEYPSTQFDDAAKRSLIALNVPI